MREKTMSIFFLQLYLKTVSADVFCSNLSRF